VLSRRNVSYPSHRSTPKSRLFNLLQPLPSLFPALVLCFQQLAASFSKTPGVGVSQLLPATIPGTTNLPIGARFRASNGPHFAKGCKNTETATTFRINTCKSVSKQSTLTTFRINTCEKPGEGGGAPASPRLESPASPYDAGNARRLHHVPPLSLVSTLDCAYFPSPRGCTLRDSSSFTVFASTFCAIGASVANSSSFRPTHARIE